MARDLAPFDFRELAPFNDSTFCMYYGALVRTERLNGAGRRTPRLPGFFVRVVVSVTSSSR